MKVKFWGTRGSIPKPGPTTLRYGGNTSCVEVRSNSGTLIIIDCGSGLHDLGQQLVAEGPVKGTILISHMHWDHIQGFPFFTPLFIPGNEWNIYAPRGMNSSLRDTLSGQMQYAYFPITLETMGAAIEYNELVEGVFEVGDIRIRTHYLNHPALTLGYRLEADGASVSYICDMEPFSMDTSFSKGSLCPEEQSILDFVKGSDLVIHDAQYTPEEYPSKVGWGHSTGKYAVKFSHAAGAKKVALTHHDPLRTDEEVDKITEDLRRYVSHILPPIEVFSAAEGQEIILEPSKDGESRQQPLEKIANDAVESAFLTHTVLVLAENPEIMSMVKGIADEDNLKLIEVSQFSILHERIRAKLPSLVILEDRMEDLEFEEFIESMQGWELLPPLVVFSEEHASSPPYRGLQIDWLKFPISREYLRTRVHYWVMRVNCKFVRAQFEDELAAQERKKSESGTTQPTMEASFDRLAREAAEIFGARISVISLGNPGGEWFQATHGIDASRASEISAFGAQVKQNKDVYILQDTLEDPSVAIHDLVKNEPKIRFFATYPIKSPDGLGLGSICLVDSNPRVLGQDENILIKRLAGKVEAEVLKNLES